MKKFIAGLAATLAMVLAGCGGTSPAQKAASVLHSAGPKTKSVTCVQTRDKHFPFTCKLYLDPPIAGQKCVTANFRFSKDWDVKKVKYDPFSIAACK